MPDEDSLVAVMGKDHPGRTRGVSHNVGVRTTLPNLASKKITHEDLESLKRTLDEQQKHIRDQENQIQELKLSNAASEERPKLMQEQIQMILSQQQSSAGGGGSPRMRHSSAGSASCLEGAVEVRNEDLEAHSKKQKLPQNSKLKQSGSFKMPAKIAACPLELQRFYNRLNSNDDLCRMRVIVEAEKEVFGVDKMLIALSYDELYDLLKNGSLESGIIAAFMRLHLLLSQKTRNNRCAFIHPDSISDV